MNFDYMPELHLWWAYPLLWLVMLAIGVGLALFFHKQRWLGNDTDPEASPADQE
jgi:magnesium transporter